MSPSAAMTSATTNRSPTTRRSRAATALRLKGQIGREACRERGEMAGRLGTPGPPAAMAAGNVETSQRITDVVLGALSKAAPERIPAASYGTMNNVTFGGHDERHHKQFAYYETIAGGHGASSQGADRKRGV